ncbi:hypothetical protein IMSAG049_00719 [Clostridiales bacterium]|nr:hypothetical protein IMSAG049_00719 [Clostridiales bacterium]
MFTKAIIIPTGDELASGIVLDTDSPAIMSRLLQINGNAFVGRCAPVIDIQQSILDTIESFVYQGFDLVVLIGGSGGGHRHSTTLGKDFTHSALDSILEDKHICELYGKNGHMWSKLVIGKLKNALVFNVPGPYAEATATINAFAETYLKNSRDLESINKSMMEALRAQYGA